MATIATFTVPQSVFSIGSHTFGPFSVPAAAVWMAAQVTRSLLTTDSGGVEVVSLSFETSPDNVTWTHLIGFGLATGVLGLGGFSGVQKQFISPSVQLRGTLITGAAVSCPVIITIQDVGG